MTIDSSIDSNVDFGDVATPAVDLDILMSSVNLDNMVTSGVNLGNTVMSDVDLDDNDIVMSGVKLGDTVTSSVDLNDAVERDVVSAAVAVVCVRVQTDGCPACGDGEDLVRGHGDVSGPQQRLSGRQQAARLAAARVHV